METSELHAYFGIALAAMFLYAIIELAWLTVFRKRSSFRHEFSQPLRNLPLIIGINVALPVLGTLGMAAIGQHFAVTQLGSNWYFWIAGFVIYEFWYWVHHFLAHKVRLLWCLHSSHHAPDTMHMFVGFNRQVLEAVYMSFFLGFVPAVCGMPVEMIVLINMFDGLWGSLLHASPKVVSWRYGLLEKIMQTPSYHRAHHAKNPRYMDTNYNSITLFWDWVFGTLQPLRDDEPVDYGITRPVDVESWRDVQLGEMTLLWRDVHAAPGFKNKICYLMMPPGWSHTGDHTMASTQKILAGVAS
ncbi:MAG: sterol desaturase family protein [Pseudomonadales bacterium]